MQTTNLNFAAHETFPEHWSLKKKFENKDPRVHPRISERRGYRTLYSTFMSRENKRMLTRVLEKMTKQMFNTDSTIFDPEMLRLYMEKAWLDSGDVADLMRERRKQQSPRKSILSSFLYGGDDGNNTNNNTQKKTRRVSSLLSDLNKEVVSHFNRKLKKYRKAGLSYYVDHVEKSPNNLAPYERPNLSTAIRHVGTGDSYSLTELGRMSSSSANNNRGRGVDVDAYMLDAEKKERGVVDNADAEDAYDRMKYVNQMTERPLASEVPMNQLEYVNFLQNVRENPEKNMTDRSGVYR